MSDHPHQAQREPWRVDEDEPWVIRQGSYYVANFSRPADAAQAVADHNAGLRSAPLADDLATKVRAVRCAEWALHEDDAEADLATWVLCNSDALDRALRSPPAPAPEVEVVARPSSEEIHAWIDRAYRKPDDPERDDDFRFTRWNMEVAFNAGFDAALQAARAGAGADDTEQAVGYRAGPSTIPRPAPPVPETAVDAAFDAWAELRERQIKDRKTWPDAGEASKAALRCALEAALPHLAQPGDATEEGR